MAVAVKLGDCEPAAVEADRLREADPVGLGDADRVPDGLNVGTAVADAVADAVSDGVEGEEAATEPVPDALLVALLTAVRLGLAVAVTVPEAEILAVEPELTEDVGVAV